MLKLAQPRNVEPQPASDIEPTSYAELKAENARLRAALAAVLALLQGAALSAAQAELVIARVLDSGV